MHLLDVSEINKLQEGQAILQGINFKQQKFQKIAIAGETGSGKSTLLKIIAGLVQPDSGNVFFEDVRIKGPEEKLMPGYAGIVYLSQQFELLNNYRVEEVLDYANKLSNEEAETIYQVCRIDHLLKRRTDQVSGGEKQRIAIARLLTSSPKLLLLDEPYSNLDMIHKSILKSVIKDIGERLSISCILISHDPLDTLSWADEIIVLKGGRIVQKGTPKEIYNTPNSMYVASLFGTYNLIDFEIAKKFVDVKQVEMKDEKLFIRPEKFTITSDNTSSVKGVVNNVRFLGSSTEIEFLSGENKFIVKVSDTDLIKGDTVCVTFSSDDPWFI